MTQIGETEDESRWAGCVRRNAKRIVKRSSLGGVNVIAERKEELDQRETARNRRLSVVDMRKDAAGAKDATEEHGKTSSGEEAYIDTTVAKTEELRRVLPIVSPRVPPSCLWGVECRSVVCHRRALVSMRDRSTGCLVHLLVFTTTQSIAEYVVNLVLAMADLKWVAVALIVSLSYIRVFVVEAFTVEIGCYSRTGNEPGSKKTNQDNCFAFEKFIRHGSSLYAVFDGHGPNGVQRALLYNGLFMLWRVGHVVSSFVKHHLPLVLTRLLHRRLLKEANDAEIQTTLKQAFIEVHEAIASAPFDSEFSGTTATVALIIGTKLFVAWVGDSRCVIGKRQRDQEAIVQEVTNDHKPDNEHEQRRIVTKGGRVERLRDDCDNEVGPTRVWMQYAWIPGLAMSRALGDLCAHQIGVSCEPDFTVTKISPEVESLVLASDGVWEFTSSQEAIDIVHSTTEASTACRKLIDEAHSRWVMEENDVIDDITVLVVKFHHNTF